MNTTSTEIQILGTLFESRSITSNKLKELFAYLVEGEQYNSLFETNIDLETSILSLLDKGFLNGLSADCLPQTRLQGYDVLENFDTLHITWRGYHYYIGEQSQTGKGKAQSGMRNRVSTISDQGSLYEQSTLPVDSGLDGQAEFRARLLNLFGSHCLISGCGVKEVLEAAHIRPYSEEYDFDDANGLILRSDIHKLFDLGQIAIDPNTLTVIVHPYLKNSIYDYNGQQLRFNNPKQSLIPDRKKLRDRFDKKGW